MRKTKKNLLPLLLGLAMMLSLCVSASAATTITLEVGDSQPVSASYQGEHIWTSEDTSVAEVVEIGDGARATIVGIGAGGTVVNCTTFEEETGDYHLDTWNVRVTEPEPEPDPEIELQQNRLDMDEGDETRLLYEVTGITGYTVDWRSSNSSVVSVDSSGNVSARRAGSATITATIRGTNASDSCDITVSAVEDPEIKFEQNSLELDAGDSTRIRYTVTGITGYTVDWSSSNGSVVFVDSSGNVSARNAGSATITATIRGTDASDSCLVTVKDALYLYDHSLFLNIGDTTELLYTATSGRSVIWSSSNPSVVAVNNGSLIALSPGAATITVRLNGTNVSDTCAVTVSAGGETGTPYQINGITLRNTSYQSVSAIPAASFYAEVSVTNLSSATMDTLILATYDANGRMLDTDFLYANPQIGQTFTFGTLIRNSDGNVKTLKAFMVPILGGVTPLSNTAAIQG